MKTDTPPLISMSSLWPNVRPRWHMITTAPDPVDCKWWDKDGRAWIKRPEDHVWSGGVKLSESAIAAPVSHGRGYMVATAVSGNEYKVHGDTPTPGGTTLSEAREATLRRALSTGDREALIMPWQSIYDVTSVDEDDDPKCSTSAWQFRPSAPVEYSNGDRAKYLWAKEDPQFYSPHPWMLPEDIASSDVPLIVAEGLLKADALLSAYLHEKAKSSDVLRDVLDSPVPSLYNARAAVESIPRAERVVIVAISSCTTWNVAEDLSELALRGREVTLAFDGDVTTSPNVWEQANKAKATILGAYGAREVQFLIPPTFAGVKGAGVDDAIARGRTYSELMRRRVEKLGRKPAGKNGFPAQPLDRINVGFDYNDDSPSTWAMRTRSTTDASGSTLERQVKENIATVAIRVDSSERTVVPWASGGSTPTRVSYAGSIAWTSQANGRRREADYAGADVSDLLAEDKARKIVLALNGDAANSAVIPGPGAAEAETRARFCQAVREEIGRVDAVTTLVPGVGPMLVDGEYLWVGSRESVRTTGSTTDDVRQEATGNADGGTSFPHAPVEFMKDYRRRLPGAIRRLVTEVDPWFANGAFVPSVMGVMACATTGYHAYRARTAMILTGPPSMGKTTGIRLASSLYGPEWDGAAVSLNGSTVASMDHRAKPFSGTILAADDLQRPRAGARTEDPGVEMARILVRSAYEAARDREVMRQSPNGRGYAPAATRHDRVRPVIVSAEAAADVGLDGSTAGRAMVFTISQDRPFLEDGRFDDDYLADLIADGDLQALFAASVHFHMERMGEYSNVSERNLNEVRGQDYEVFYRAALARKDELDPTGTQMTRRQQDVVLPALSGLEYLHAAVCHYLPEDTDTQELLRDWVDKAYLRIWAEHLHGQEAYIRGEASPGYQLLEMIVGELAGGRAVMNLDTGHVTDPRIGMPYVGRILDLDDGVKSVRLEPAGVHAVVRGLSSEFRELSAVRRALAEVSTGSNAVKTRTPHVSKNAATRMYDIDLVRWVSAGGDRLALDEMISVYESRTSALR